MFGFGVRTDKSIPIRLWRWQKTIVNHDDPYMSYVVVSDRFSRQSPDNSGWHIMEGTHNNVIIFATKTETQETK